MTTTYDPSHAAYLDEADVRLELARVFDVCDGCRRCIEFCPSFPTLFEMLDAQADRADRDNRADRDTGRMTPAQQDEVIAGCFQCGRCALSCPYTPERHEAAVDVPRLMLRAKAMRHTSGHRTAGEKAASRVMARTDRVGRLATTAAPAVNALMARPPESLARRALAKLTGASAVRLLPTYTRQRFSSWFEQRPRITLGRKQGRVTVFPTCVVEYQAPEIGRDLVKVYERNGIECSVSRATCCGAPWLHTGDLSRFRDVAAKNVRTLAAEIRAGTDVVVPQPTCAVVVKSRYPEYVEGADPTLVADHTYDAAEYLMKVHRDDATLLDTHFEGEVPATVTYHVPCRVLTQDIGLASRDLMKLTGTRVIAVQRCAGSNGTWGLRAGNEALAIPLARHLAEGITAADSETVVGDCHLANTATAEQTDAAPLHPIQVLARAYGIPTDAV